MSETEEQLELERGLVEAIGAARAPMADAGFKLAELGDELALRLEHARRMLMRSLRLDVGEQLKAGEIARPVMAQAARKLKAKWPTHASRLEEARRLLARAADAFLPNTQPIDTRDVKR